MFKVQSTLTRPSKTAPLFNVGETWQNTWTSVATSARGVNLSKITFLLWVELPKISILVKEILQAVREKSVSSILFWKGVWRLQLIVFFIMSYREVVEGVAIIGALEQGDLEIFRKTQNLSSNFKMFMFWGSF